MMQRFMITLLMAVLAVIPGCEDSLDTPAEAAVPDGAYLLGLTRNHQLRYIIYDSLVTDPFDSAGIIYDTSYMEVTITRGQNGQVQLAVDGEPHDLLTVDPQGVLHSGQIRPHAAPPDTIFLYPTPLIIPRTYLVGNSWSYVSPRYIDSAAEVRRTVLFLNYGFITERECIGTADVILPTKSYDAWQFQALLYLDDTAVEPFITVDEYYAPGVGLVQLVSHSGFSRRLIILLEDH